VDIIEGLLDRGFEPAIRVKETMRMSIRHPLRKLSNENWKSYGKMRYRVEQLFCSMKQKIGSSFKLLREDLARKASVACAILWNFWVLAVSLLLLFLSGILHYSYANGYGRFLEQPLLRLDRKFAILSIILLFALIFVNQNAFEFLLKVLEVIK